MFMEKNNRFSLSFVVVFVLIGFFSFFLEVLPGCGQAFTSPLDVGRPSHPGEFKGRKVYPQNFKGRKVYPRFLKVEKFTPEF